MHGTFLVEVGYKTGVVDPVGRTIKADAHHSKLPGRLKDARATQLYRLVGDITLDDKNRIARDLLTDPVTQAYGDGQWAPAPRKDAASARKAESPIVVDVWFKSGVTDVVGESVAKGIADLGIGGVASVRTGARYRFWGLRNAQQAEKLTLALLANPLIHDYVLHHN